MQNQINISLDDMSRLQTRIMHFIDKWVRSVKTPVPQKEIVAQLVMEGMNSYTIVSALSRLLRKGYIRKEVSISNRVRYVQIRSI